jgi:glycerol transport system permease protein
VQVLIIQIPLGVAIGVAMPKRGWRASLALVLMALPLLIPFNVVGTIWQIFAREDIGLGGHVVNDVLGLEYNYTQSPRDAWNTVLLMDTWHWTPLVALLVYAGLRSIPEAYYRAATIDGANRFAIFRFIELPRLRGVLTIAILLRFMDSFMIYTEPFVVTGGGPGNTTNFLSISLTKMAVGQFDLGRSAAYSLVYFFFIQLFCFVFYTALRRV